MSVKTKWVEVLPGNGALTDYSIGEILEVVELEGKNRVRILRDGQSWTVDNKWFKFVDPPEVSCL